jgi:phosphopantetheine--protein transferase-like protein
MAAAQFVYRYLARSTMSSLGCVHAGETWLSACEMETYAEMHNARRREEWLFGRVLAKQLILNEVIGQSSERRIILPSEIQIFSRDGFGRNTRPLIILNGQLQSWSLSIAHSDQSVLVALAQRPGVSIGVDVTPVQKQSESFINTWLTPYERRWIRKRDNEHLASILWSIKEAFYKATNRYEQFVPRRIEVYTTAPDYYCLRFDGEELSNLCKVYVLEANEQIAVIVTVVTSDEEGY